MQVDGQDHAKEFVEQNTFMVSVTCNMFCKESQTEVIRTRTKAMPGLIFSVYVAM